LLKIRGWTQELKRKAEIVNSNILESTNIQDPKKTYELFEVMIFEF